MKKILIIDDNEDNRYLLRFFLTKNGFAVLEAFDGETGIELAQKELPDLILMDIKMPGIDGLEATRRIRLSRSAGKIPIIALTSYAMTGDEARARKAGCNGYIPKPVDLGTFLSQIDPFLNQKKT